MSAPGRIPVCWSASHCSSLLRCSQSQHLCATKEGTVHGFLVVRTMEGKTIAAGDLIQVVEGDRLVSNLSFHFKTARSMTKQPSFPKITSSA